MIEQLTKKKGLSFILSGKTMVIALTVELIKKVQLYEIDCFPETYINSKKKIKVELDLSNYTRNSELKNAKGVNTSDSDFGHW